MFTWVTAPGNVEKEMGFLFEFDIFWRVFFFDPYKKNQD